MQNSQHWRLATPLTFSLIILVLSTVPSAIPAVHAAGTLYINPSSRPIAPAGTNVTYQVKVANIDPFNGWDIMVKTDPTAINPASFTITPNLLAANYNAIQLLELIHCVNRVGTSCTAGDGPGIVHSAVIALTPPPQTGPSSGVLFTITYTAGVNTFSTVHIFNDLISDGSFTPVAHTNQDGVYGIPPDFTITASPTSLKIGEGSDGTSLIILTSLNGPSATMTLSLTVSNTTITNGPTASLSPASVTLIAGGTATPILTVLTGAATPIGRYTVNVTATNGAISHLTQVSINVTIPTIPDFDITGDAPSPASFLAGGSTTSTITLNSLGFTGSITLAASTATPVTGLALTFSTNPVTLAASGTGTSVLTIATEAATPAGTYTITVAGTSGGTIGGTLSHSTAVSVTVIPDFTITTGAVTPPSLVTGGSATSTITLGSLGFTGSITLAGSTATPVPGLTLTFGTNPVPLTAGGSGSSTLTVSTKTSTPAGTYAVIVTGIAGSLKHSVTIPIIVNPSIVITNVAILPTGSITIGQRVTVTVTVLNNGTNTQTFTLRILWGDLTVAQQTETLNPGEQRPFPLSWDTSGRTPDNRPITAVISPGNSMTGPSVALTAPTQPFLTSSQILLSTGGAAAAIILLSLFLFLRRKKIRSPQGPSSAPPGIQ